MILSTLEALVTVHLLLGAPMVGDQSSAEVEPNSFRRVLVQVEPADRMVGIALRFPSGYESDPEGLEGISVLLGQALEAEGGARMANLEARLAVQVERQDSYIVLLATPSRWTEAVQELNALLTGPSLSTAVMERERQRLIDRAVFEDGAPIRTFERESARMLLGLTAPGARRPRGTVESLDAMDMDAMVRHRNRGLRLEDATAVVVGPVGRNDVERVFSGAIEWIEEEAAPRSAPRPPLLPRDTTVAEDAPTVSPLPPAPHYRTGLQGMPPLRPPSSPGSPAWAQGDRLVLDRELTSSWLGIAYPLPRDTPPILLAFLRHLVSEDMNPFPPDPGVYEADARIEWIDGAPILYLVATVDPRFTAEWEERLHSALARLAEEPPTGSFFELTRRRFRSSLALELAAPDLRALWFARQSSIPGLGGDRADLPSPTREIWRLDREGVSLLAGAAGPPRILLFGPVDMMER